MKPWISTALLLLLSLPPATGQDGRKAAEVEFRVTRFDPGDRPSPKFEVGPPGGDRTEIEVPMTYIAGPFKAPLRDDRFLDLWRDEGEQPEISLPITEAERKDLLLFFIPQEESFRVIKVRTPLGRIRGGDRYLINASPRPLAIKTDQGKQLLLEPGKGDILRGPGGDDISAMKVLVSLKQEESWRLASTETWYSDPRFRKYLFAYLSPRSGQLVFHSVSERL